jgi:hypothetical protein
MKTQIYTDPNGDRYPYEVDAQGDVVERRLSGQENARIEATRRQGWAVLMSFLPQATAEDVWEQGRMDMDTTEATA